MSLGPPTPSPGKRGLRRCKRLQPLPAAPLHLGWWISKIQDLVHLQKRPLHPTVSPLGVGHRRLPPPPPMGAGDPSFKTSKLLLPCIFAKGWKHPPNNLLCLKMIDWLRLGPLFWKKKIYKTQQNLNHVFEFLKIYTFLLSSLKCFFCFCEKVNFYVL